MKSKQKHLIAEIMTAIVIAASILQYNALPVFALAATSMKDTLDRAKASTAGVAHSVSLTLPAGGVPNTQTLTLTYASFTAFAGSPTATCAGGGTATAAVGSGNVLTITGSGTGCNAGGLTVTGFTGTNPAAGTYTVTLAGSAGVTGTFSLSIVSEDQVSITASIDPSITFNVGAEASGTPCATTFAGNGGTVALGTLTTGAVASSDASSVQHICSRITTNAGSGAVVTVRSLNAALTSTGTPAHTIASASTTLTAGTSGYGLCAGSAGGDTGLDTTTPAGATATRSAPFNGASCTSSGHVVGALTTGAQTVWSVSAASQNVFYRMYVKAAISGTVPAHTDYADTLTFVATGTF